MKMELGTIPKRIERNKTKQLVGKTFFESINNTNDFYKRLNYLKIGDYFYRVKAENRSYSTFCGIRFKGDR